jgi:hypothetical protein
MNIFHEVATNTTVSDTLVTLSLIVGGVGVLFHLLYILLQWKKKPYVWAIATGFATLGVAVVLAGTCAVMSSSERVAAREETSVSLQSWSKDNYGIELSKDNADALIGLRQRAKAVAVDYKGKPTVVQLIDYKNGYILVNNENQEALPQK